MLQDAKQTRKEMTKLQSRVATNCRLASDLIRKQQSEAAFLKVCECKNDLTRLAGLLYQQTKSQKWALAICSYCASRLKDELIYDQPSILATLADVIETGFWKDYAN